VLRITPAKPPAIPLAFVDITFTVPAPLLVIVPPLLSPTKPPAVFVPARILELQTLLLLIVTPLS